MACYKPIWALDRENCTSLKCLVRSGNSWIVYYLYDWHYEIQIDFKTSVPCPVRNSPQFFDICPCHLSGPYGNLDYVYTIVQSPTISHPLQTWKNCFAVHCKVENDSPNLATGRRCLRNFFSNPKFVADCLLQVLLTSFLLFWAIINVESFEKSSSIQKLPAFHTMHHGRLFRRIYWDPPKPMMSMKTRRCLLLWAWLRQCFIFVVQHCHYHPQRWW